MGWGRREGGKSKIETPTKPRETDNNNNNNEERREMGSGTSHSKRMVSVSSTQTRRKHGRHRTPRTSTQEGAPSASSSTTTTMTTRNPVSAPQPDHVEVAVPPVVEVGHPRAGSHLGLAMTFKAEQQAMVTLLSTTQREPRLSTGVVFRSNRDGIMTLVDQGFAEFPTILLTFGHIVQLDLSDNFIPEIPESIAQLTALSVLVMSGNVISDLPHGLSCLTNLRLLHLAFNLISNINPDSVRFRFPHTQALSHTQPLTHSPTRSLFSDLRTHQPRRTPPRVQQIDIIASSSQPQ